MTTLSGSDYQAEDYRQTNQLSEPGTPRTPAGVVELRVHGVAGGTASQNLGDPHPIRINGDSEAGVYRRREALNTGPDRTVEAYNWSSINSGRTARAFWVVLFPFAAANFAGWLLPYTMRDPRRSPPPAPDESDSEQPRSAVPNRAWDSVGSYLRPYNNRMWAQACVRIVSLVITAVVVLGVAAISMDIVGLQCGVRGACSQPWWFGWFESVRESSILEGHPTRFVIVGALVPLAVLGILWQLGKRSATYDRYGTDHEKGRDHPEGAYVDTIRLDTLDFWQSPDTTYIQAWLHGSVALSMLAVVLSASMVQLAQGSSLRPAFYTFGVLGGIWLAVLVVLVVVVGWMRQIPRRWLRRSTRSALRPRLTWIPAAVPGSLLLLTAILGWAVAGSLPSDTFVLEPIRNGLIWTTIAGMIALLLLGLLVGAWRVILLSLAIGGLWYMLLGSADDIDGRVGQAPFLLDIGDSWQWVLAESALAALFLLFVVRTLRNSPKTGDPTRRNGLIYVVAASGVLVGLAMGADARAQGDGWWAVGLTSGAIAVAFLFAAFSLRAHKGRTAREIDAPEAGRMRSGTAFVLAAIALTAVLAMMASLIIWIASALGEGIPHSGNVDVSNDQVAYAAEAGWFALAAVVGMVVLIGMLVIRLAALRLYRWTGDTAKMICQAYDKKAPPSYSDNPEPCKPAGPHSGWRLKLAKSSRTLRLWANVIDEVDWIATAAVMATLAVVAASVIARVRGNLPGGRIVEAVSAATWVLALLTIAAFLLIRSARDDRQLRATVGILWEVMSFFPRRFHPLAPPCYSERTVIELRNRLIEYKKGESERGVILLAHSQGTMLTTAALLTLNGPTPTRVPPKIHAPDGSELDNLAFVTYGCMLERLFRRAWPDQLQRIDLVRLKERLEGTTTPLASRGDGPHPYPLPTGRPRWMNFGRYTDYLGGRVFAPLQKKPTPTPTEADTDTRQDDVMFQDPTRRWRFVGETTGPRTWLHSFNYESDTEDHRFRDHVWAWARTLGQTVVGGTDPPNAPESDR